MTDHTDEKRHVGSSRSTGPYIPASGSVLRVLTGVQNVSALAFSTFLGIHLAAPLAAALGGASLADKTMVSPMTSPDSSKTSM